MASPEFTGPLPNGKYYIQKHNTNSFVGLEKDILDPRPPHSVNVVLFPAEIKQTVWTVSFDENSCEIFTESYWASPSDNEVIALRSPINPPRWSMLHFPKQGPYSYMLTKANTPVAKKWWYVSTVHKPHAEVELKDVGSILPQNPPEGALFDFIPVLNATE